MLVIRLSRIGHENLQKFRLIVQEKTSSPKSGKVIALVGHYNPENAENKLVFDAAKIETFLKNGATPSDTVARLLLKNGFKKELVTKFVLKYTKQKSKKAPKEEAKPAAAPAAPKAEDAPKA
ncbi:MAG: 30S ribosomal protein S16 [Patescibacteria group bacterium]|jgi:small subunit ribosomal protein S16